MKVEITQAAPVTSTKWFDPSLLGNVVHYDGMTTSQYLKIFEDRREFDFFVSTCPKNTVVRHSNAGIPIGLHFVDTIGKRENIRTYKVTYRP